MALDDFDRSSGGVFDQRVCNGIMADRDGIGAAGAEVASEHSEACGRQPIERPSPSVCSTLPRLTRMDKRLNLLITLAEQSLRSMRGDDKIAGMEVGCNHILQQQGVIAIKRDKRVVALLGFRYVSKGSNIAELPSIDLILPRDKVSDRVLHRRRTRREYELVGASASRENILVAGRKNHVLAGCPLQGNVGAAPCVVEDEIHGVGGAETVGDGECDLVGRRRRQAGIISYAGVQSGVDLGQEAGACRCCRAARTGIGRYRIDREGFGGCRRVGVGDV